MPSFQFPMIGGANVKVNVDLDVAETLSTEVPVIRHSPAWELFQDRVRITSDGSKVTIKPSYERGTFDTYEVDRSGNVSVKTWGGLRNYGTPAVGQTPLRQGLASILRASQAKTTDGTLAAKLATIAARLEQVTACEYAHPSDAPLRAACIGTP